MKDFGYVLIAIVGIIAAIAAWVFGIGFTVTLGAFLLKSLGVTALNQVTFGMALKFLVGGIATQVVAIAANISLAKRRI
tara:strand:+ start:16 stop:252 length:237 start_codon:yes stop_codon:yes gene_type:complete